MKIEIAGELNSCDIERKLLEIAKILIKRTAKERRGIEKPCE